MLGAITGDIIGSVYEWHNIKSKEFELFDEECFFTDDTVLTIALAESILMDLDYGEVMKKYYFQYPNAGYGTSFHHWARSDECNPYNSWGNGSAMRTSPVGFLFKNLDEVLEKAKYYASFTHNHPEGIKGAQAVSSSVFLARTGKNKSYIKRFVEDAFQYDLSFTLDEIRPSYTFDVSCQGSVPQSIVAFLESTSYEDAIRNAISIGGDSDTLACITGGIAESFYGGVPDDIASKSMNVLTSEFREIIEIYNSWTKNEGK